MSTIKQIAQMAGVSRGTVDRVLNNRGAVKPETAQRIQEIAEALQYTPSVPGKTLAIKKKKLLFGFILFGGEHSNNPFFDDVLAGIERKRAELAQYDIRVEVRYAQIDNPELQVRLLSEMVALGASGIAITPIHHPLVVDAVRQLVNDGIPVVTVNSDLPESGRIAYVGSDYYRSGETAAGMLGLVTGGKANVGVITGSPWVLCHSQRLAGFTSIMGRRYQGMRVVATAQNNDDDLLSYKVTLDMLREHHEIDTLFLAAAGVHGALRAVEEEGLAGKLRILTYDLTPASKQGILSGAIVATITQQPSTQGSRPLELLLQAAAIGQAPKKELFYTKIEIKIRENL